MFRTAFLDLPPLATAGGTVHLPGSKSISNRVLLLAALSAGTTTIHDLLDSDDTRVMLAGLQQLGCRIAPTAVTPGQPIAVTGIGGQLPAGTAATLFLGNAGTAMRPLTAALAVLGGSFEMTGVARMYERPIGDLVDALRQLGCSIDYLGNPGFPPLKIGQPDFSQLSNAPIQVRGDVSSQFLTSLLMALPLLANVPGAQRDITIEVVGELISKPYIHITLELLARFGIAVKNEDWQRFVIPAGSRYQSPGAIHVEADASSASYFIALGALAASTAGHSGVKILGVGQDSIQGDIRFVEAARAMGAQVDSGPNWLQVSRGAWPLKAIDLDCNHIPDAAMTLAIMALYAEGTTRLTNIASWRVKETDRIAAMATELRKLGATVEEGADYICITPPGQQPSDAGPPQVASAPSGGSAVHAVTSVGAQSHWCAASIHTYDDHRVAMCFSLAAFNPAGLPVRIEDPQCVAKTFPDYFEALFSVCGTANARIPVICIDGTSGSGKGTIAAQVAEALGYHLLDSGALYRITGLVATRAGLALEATNAERIAALIATQRLEFTADQRVLVNGEDVSLAIRSEEAGMHASQVSAFPAVRAALVGVQHAFRALPGLVADGRDMGTVIFPDASLKVYLTASVQCRADRRYKQLISKGLAANIDALFADLEARDARDMQRAAAPLKPAEDALQLDNSSGTIEEAVQQVLAWWSERQPFA